MQYFYQEKKTKPKQKSQIVNDKKVMRDPHQFFNNQCENITEEFMPQINEFVKSLIDLENCLLCRNQYDLLERMPKILIHCGHTVCTDCLQKFHQDYKVRCPLCLKLIKNIETLDRIPINHTIFTNICDQINEQNKNQGIEELNPQELLIQHFSNACQEQQGQLTTNFNLISAELLLELRSQQPYSSKPEQIDLNSFEISSCENHPERVDHFYCAFHKTITCRICTEESHQQQMCLIVDLYEVDDIPQFLFQVFDLDLIRQNDFQKEEQVNEFETESESNNSI